MKFYILCIVRWLGRECNTSKFEETPLELKFGLVAPITSDEKYIWQFEQIYLQFEQMQHLKVNIGPKCPWGPIYGFGSLKQTEPRFADLTDVTLAAEDTNPILLIMLKGQSNAMWQCK